jgi:hypothetical protein
MSREENACSGSGENCAGGRVLPTREEEQLALYYIMLIISHNVLTSPRPLLPRTLSTYMAEVRVSVPPPARACLVGGEVATFITRREVNLRNAGLGAAEVELALQPLDAPFRLSRSKLSLEVGESTSIEVAALPSSAGCSAELLVKSQGGSKQISLRSLSADSPTEEVDGSHDNSFDAMRAAALEHALADVSSALQAAEATFQVRLQEAVEREREDVLKLFGPRESNALSTDRTRELEEQVRDRTQQVEVLVEELGHLRAKVGEMERSASLKRGADDGGMSTQAWWVRFAMQSEQEKVKGSGSLCSGAQDLQHQNLQQLSLELAMAKQRTLRAELQLREKERGFEERLASAAVRVASLEAEAKSARLAGTTQIGHLQKTVESLRAHSDKAEAVASAMEALGSERVRREEAEVRAELQQQIAAEERYAKEEARRRIVSLESALGRRAVGETLKLGAGAPSPRDLIEQFAGLMQKHAQTQFQNKKSALEGVAADADEYKMNELAAASLELGRLSQREAEANAEADAAREREIDLSNQVQRLESKLQDAEGRLAAAAEHRLHGAQRELATMKEALRGALAHNAELKDELVALSASGSTSSTSQSATASPALTAVPAASSRHFSPATASMVDQQRQSDGVEEERLRPLLQESMAKIRVLEATVHALQEASVSTPAATQGGGGKGRGLDTSTSAYDLEFMGRDGLINHAVELSSEVCSLRERLGLSELRVNSLLSEVASNEGMRVRKESRLSELESMWRSSESEVRRLGAQLSAVKTEGRSRLREIHDEVGRLRSALLEAEGLAQSRELELSGAVEQLNAAEERARAGEEQLRRLRRDADAALEVRAKEVAEVIFADADKMSPVAQALRDLAAAWCPLDSADREEDASDLDDPAFQSLGGRSTEGGWAQGEGSHGFMEPSARQLLEYVRLLTVRLDSECRNAVRGAAVSAWQARRVSRDCEYLREELDEANAEVSRLGSCLKVTEAALYACNTGAMGALSLASASLLERRASAAAEGALEMAADKAVLQTQASLLQERLGAMEKQLSLERNRADRADADARARADSAVAAALAEASEWRHTIGNQLAAFWESELAPLTAGVDRMSGAESLAQALVACKAAQAEAEEGRSTCFIQLRRALLETERLKALLPSATAVAAPLPPRHTTDQTISNGFEPLKVRAEALSLELLKARDAAARSTAEAAELRKLTQLARDDCANVRTGMGDRIQAVRSQLRRRCQAEQEELLDLLRKERERFKRELAAVKSTSLRKEGELADIRIRNQELELGTLRARLESGGKDMTTSRVGETVDTTDELRRLRSAVTRLASESDSAQRMRAEAESECDRLMEVAAEARTEVHRLAREVSLQKIALGSIEECTNGGREDILQAVAIAKMEAAELDQRAKSHAFQEASLRRTLLRRDRRITELQAQLRHTRPAPGKSLAGPPLSLADALKDEGNENVAELGQGDTSTAMLRQRLAAQSEKIMDLELQLADLTAGGAASRLISSRGNSDNKSGYNNDDQICQGCQQLAEQLRDAEQRGASLQKNLDEAELQCVQARSALASSKSSEKDNEMAEEVARLKGANGKLETELVRLQGELLELQSTHSFSILEGNREAMEQRYRSDLEALRGALDSAQLAYNQALRSLREALAKARSKLRTGHTSQKEPGSAQGASTATSRARTRKSGTPIAPLKGSDTEQTLKRLLAESEAKCAALEMELQPLRLKAKVSEAQVSPAVSGATSFQAGAESLLLLAQLSASEAEVSRLTIECEVHREVETELKKALAIQEARESDRLISRARPEASDQINRLKEGRREAKAEVLRLKAMLAHLNASRPTTEAAAAAEEEHAATKAALASARADSERKAKALLAARAAKLADNEELERLRHEISALGAKLQRASRDMSSKVALVAQLRDKISSLEEDLSKEKEKNEARGKEPPEQSSPSRDRDRLRAQVSALRARAEKEAEAVTTAQSLLADAQAKADDAARRLKDLKSELARKTSEAKHLAGVVDELTRQLQDCRHEQERERSQASVRISELEAQAVAAGEEIGPAQLQARQAQASLDTLRSSLLMSLSLMVEENAPHPSEVESDASMTNASRVSSLLGLSQAEVHDIMGAMGPSGEQIASLRRAEDALSISDGHGFTSVVRQVVEAAATVHHGFDADYRSSARSRSVSPASRIS